MKRFLFLFLISSRLFAEEAFVVDRYLSPYAGAYDFLFAHRALTNGEDFIFRNEGSGSTAKVWGRAIEQIAIWNILNGLANVSQHEFFGHGYRSRELGFPPKKYKITPWYGYTKLDLSEDLPVGEFMSIVVAGLEAQGILAFQTKFNWMSEEVIDGRLSTLYTQAEQSSFWYVIVTGMGRLRGDSTQGNDIENYLTLLDVTYPNDDFGLGTLTKWVAFSWLDPMTFFAYFSWFYYIAEGKAWKYPMIPLARGVRYLPNIRIGLAPYGPEAYLENFFSLNRKALYVYAKGGKRSIGVGAQYDHLFSGSRGRIGFRLDGWWQNEFITSATLDDLIEDLPIPRPELKDKLFGVAASLTGRLKLFSSTGLFIELGGKTNGYLPGYQLDSGLVARVGLVLGQQ